MIQSSMHKKIDYYFCNYKMIFQIFVVVCIISATLSQSQIIGGCNPVDLCVPQVIQTTSCAVERYLNHIDHACYEYNVNHFCEQVVNGLIYQFDVNIRPNLKTRRCASYFESWSPCETISFNLYQSPIYNGMLPRCDGQNDIMCGTACLTVTDSRKIADCSRKNTY